MGFAFWSVWLLQAALADTVAVESEPRSAELEQAVLDGCSGALGTGRCRPTGVRAAEAPAPTWFALVRWQVPDARHARVEFHRRDAQGELVDTREVEFTDADSEAQRRKAVGLIIAAFVVEHSEAQAQPTPAPQPSPAVTPRPKPKPEERREPTAEPDEPEDDDGEAEPVIEIAPDLTPPPRPPKWALDLAVLGGPGLEEGAPRFGVLARGLLWPLPVPIAPLVSLRGAQRFEQPSVRWLSGSLGAQWSLLPLNAPAGLELRAEAVLQNVRMEAEEPGGSDREHGDVWRGGAAAGAGAWLALGGGVALIAGAELMLLQPRVHLDIGGDSAGLDPALSWSGSFGVRVAR